jgi:hypothetical protein
MQLFLRELILAAHREKLHFGFACIAGLLAARPAAGNLPIEPTLVRLVAHKWPGRRANTCCSKSAISRNLISICPSSNWLRNFESIT